MKKLLSLLVFSICAFSLAAQSGTDNRPAYLRFPKIPPIKILKPDSSSYFTRDNLKKNKPVMIMIFNPECEHCQHETEALINNIKDLSNIQIVMATPQPFGQMKAFYERYGLQRFSNIFVGQDERFVLPSFFMIHNLPYLAFYDKKQDLISTHEGTMPVNEILNVFKK
ncbi:MAG TPA: thioredoxin [Chitinophagaceae bacterium]|jgi:thiol-disulfide isomerase/thioredoxin|nr:thioredoxin [Chitinophagaceae bacterium]